MKRSDLSKIMSEAWLLVKTYALTISEALKKAWALFNVVNKMKKGVASFRFEKVNGEIRQAFGTLEESRLPKIESTSNRAKSPFIQTYFDVEKNEFRCFKIINLIA
jgi:hypothetical protein